MTALRMAPSSTGISGLESAARCSGVFRNAVYFAVEADVVVVLAIPHASRDPAEWQRLKGLTTW
jgi:hypothetical protein